MGVQRRARLNNSVCIIQKRFCLEIVLHKRISVALFMQISFFSQQNAATPSMERAMHVTLATKLMADQKQPNDVIWTMQTKGEQ